jgi:DNA-binding PadR family transcriptional regulator
LKNRSSELYELFVLGKLLDRPAHGYFLSKIIGYAMGPFRKVAWSTLYPLIRRLQEQDLIREHESASHDRIRRVYTITPAGKRRFHDLMMRVGQYGDDFEEWFRIRLANFRHVSPDEREIGHPIED